MFKISENKGFQIKFANGYTVSVRWGAGNYCGNYDIHSISFQNCGTPVPPSETAEIAVFDPEGNFVDLDGDQVAGYQTPEEVAAIIAKYSAI